MKRGGIVFLVLLVLIVASVFWFQRGGKETLKQEAMERAPKIHVSAMDITDIDQESIKMVSTTVMENPLPMDLEVDSLRYELWIDSSQVVESTYPKQIVIPESDSASIKLPLELELRKMNAIFKKFEQEDRDSADYTLKANFKMKVPVAGKRDFDVNVTRRLPALRGIKVTPGKIDIENLGLKDSEVNMNVEVQNNNSFDIKIKGARYDLTIDKDLELEGVLEDMIVIPARGKETVSMNMKIKTAKVPKLGWKMLFRDKQTRFVMNYSGTVLSDMQMMSNTSMKMRAEGTLEEMKELVSKK